MLVNNNIKYNRNKRKRQNKKLKRDLIYNNKIKQVKIILSYINKINIDFINIYQKKQEYDYFDDNYDSDHDYNEKNYYLTIYNEHILLNRFTISIDIKSNTLILNLLIISNIFFGFYFDKKGLFICKKTYYNNKFIFDNDKYIYGYNINNKIKINFSKYKTYYIIDKNFEYYNTKEQDITNYYKEYNIRIEYLLYKIKNKSINLNTINYLVFFNYYYFKYNIYIYKTKCKFINHRLKKNRYIKYNISHYYNNLFYLFI